MWYDLLKSLISNKYCEQKLPVGCQLLTLGLDSTFTIEKIWSKTIFIGDSNLQRIFKGFLYDYWLSSLMWAHMQLDRLSEFGHEAAHQTYTCPDSLPLTKPWTSLKSLQTRYPAGGHPTKTPGRLMITQKAKAQLLSHQLLPQHQFSHTYILFWLFCLEKYSWIS